MPDCAHRTIELRTAAGEWWCCDCGQAVPRNQLAQLARTLKVRADKEATVTQ